MLTEHFFNVHDLVQLMTAGLAILLAVPLLAPRSRRQVADLPLAVFLLAQAMIALSYVMLYNDTVSSLTINWLAPFHFLPLTLAYLAQGLAILWYSHALLQKPLQWHLADLLSSGLLIGITLVHAVHQLVFSDVPLPMDEGGVIVPSPALLVSIIFGVRAVRIINRYNTDIRERYSNIDDSNLIWLTYATCGFVAIWVWRWLAPGVIPNYPAAILIAWMVILGLGQRPKASPDPIPEVSTRQRDSMSALAVHGDKLSDLMQRVRLYQDPELDLEGLADSMGISTRSLSSVINQYFGKNFYDFVNEYRIEDAKAQLSCHKSAAKPIQRIFEDVGFNSKSTFNSTFKKATGRTPSEFRRNALK